MKWRTTITALALIVLPLATLGSPGSAERDRPQLILVGRDGSSSDRFTVEGTSVQGLYPGAARRIRLTIVNPGRWNLRIDRLGGRVVRTSRRGCPTSGLRVSSYGGRLPALVRAHGRTTLPGTFSVSMPPSTTPKCAATRFTIGLYGAGARTGR
ncbi:hypothetical protein ACQP2F_42065 [Actinoplanes sp. CA-030573]|uniref:hypothetical protein n=1 Tax=Actinoplanes sp. CA-030573 TaxID=3239898 RepID=UPI003D8BB9A9